LDSPALDSLHDRQNGIEWASQDNRDVLALPGREELRLHRMLAGRARRVCGLQGERAGMAVASMNNSRNEGSPTGTATGKV